MNLKIFAPARGANGLGQVILFYYFFYSDSNPIRLYSGRKILIYTQLDRVMDRPDSICVK
jgi:hypothetical protein